MSSGSGDREKLAAGVKLVWEAIEKVWADQPQPASHFAVEML